MSSSGSFSGGGRLRPLTVLRNPTARRMRLAVDPCDGTVRLTLPRRASLSAGADWAEGHRGWIEAALAKLPAGTPFADGAAFPLEGGTVAVAWAAGHARTPVLEDGRLLVGGPAELLAGRVARWLKARALNRLAAETREIAAQAGLAVGSVAVGDPRGRWGSCSASGDIRYSWRLILAPPDVRRATVAHEVAHRRHMHHGPDFHAMVEELFGRDPGRERAWLKVHGAALHWVGRAG